MASTAGASAAALPYLDQHTIEIAAGVDGVWAALTDTLERAFAPRWAVAYARIVGCADTTASGARPLDEGSTIPGFRVVDAEPGRQLVLEGRHHFSAYDLILRLEQIDSERSRLSAESRASFPGLHGAVYRLLVVGTRGHVIAVRRLLASIRRRSEPSARTTPQPSDPNAGDRPSLGFALSSNED